MPPAAASRSVSRVLTLPCSSGFQERGIRVGAAHYGAATPCAQSQIGQGCYLGGQGTAQVEDAVALSVVVR
jgi:hypothetical protein